MKFFYHDGYEFHLVDTAEEARSRAEAALDAHTNGGETSEETESVCWGEIYQQAVETVLDTVEQAEARGDEEVVQDLRRNGWDYLCSWALKDTPAMAHFEALRVEAVLALDKFAERGEK